MAVSQLTSPIKLGSHLLAQTDDGMLTSAMAVLDEETGMSMQSTINGIRSELNDMKGGDDSGIEGLSKSVENLTTELSLVPGKISAAESNAKSYADTKVAALKPKSGTTAQRPTLTSSDAGTAYYDKTLGYVVYWTGAKWVSALGSDENNTITITIE